MNNSRRQAFTLIEILLVIVILMMFIGSAVYYMSPALHAVKLEEGCARLQSMLKFASAEASQTGKRVRISFASTNDTAGNTVFIPRVFMEMNPISAPGEYTLMPEVTWLDSGILDLVNLQMVQRSEETEDEEDEESEEGDEEEEETLAERLEESDNALTSTVAEASGDSAESSESDADDSSESKSSSSSSSKKSSTTSSTKSSSAKSADIPLAFTNKNEFYSAMEGNIVDGDTTITGDDSDSEELDEALEDAEGLEDTDTSILFYPDGSSDSVILKLVSVDEEDTRQAILYLNGITGFVELRYVQTNSDSGTDEEDEEEDETAEDSETEENIDAANEAMVGDGEAFYGGSEGSSKRSSGKTSVGSSSGNSGSSSDSGGTRKKINLE